MRNIFPAASAVFVALAAPAFAGHFAPDGAFEGKVSARIHQALNAYERARDAPALERAVAALIRRDPHLADDAIYASLGLSEDEQTDIADGLAIAYSDLKTNDPANAAVIANAVKFAPQPFQIAFNAELADLSRIAASTNAKKAGNDGFAGDDLGIGNNPPSPLVGSLVSPN